MPQYRFLDDKPTANDVLALFEDASVKLSRRDVQGLLNVGRSNALNNLLEQLVADGFLEHCDARLINHAIIFLYRLNPHA